jgi:DNA-binding CsgD family transcriptional regulator
MIDEPPGIVRSMIISMYLSAAKAQILSSVMRTLVEPHAEDEVRRRVGTLLLGLLDADYYASYVWSDAEHCFGSRVALNMDDSNLATYEGYYQYHDPITPEMQQRREPTLVVQVMQQRDLVRTEFFNDFLYRDGLYWGVNLYAWDGEHNIGDMRIWRSRRRENFDQNAIDLLALIKPAFVAALKHSRGSVLLHEPMVNVSALLATLSEREREIVRLVALGWPDKAIAQQLGIAFTTVRTHMSHIFQKLGFENRVQLASYIARQHR